MSERLMTPPALLWNPPADMTYGDMVADWSASELRFRGIPMVMDAEQRLILDAIFSPDLDRDEATFFEVVAVACRQNLKTAVLQVAALADLFLFDVRLHVWTAHLFPTARKAFEGMVEMIETNPALRRRCRAPRMTNGDESIERLDGSTIEFRARSDRGSRGFTGDRITVDEALFVSEGQLGAVMPILATIPGAQIRYGSSAGIAQSGHLQDLRRRARAGAEPGLFYVEWAAPRRDCGTKGCEHRDVDDPTCALNDRALWRAANPALGRRITEDRIAKFRGAMPPAEFMREFLGWWDEPADELRLIPADPWKAAGVDLDAPNSQIVQPIAVGIEVELDRKHSSVVIAGYRADGRLQVELVSYGAGTSWLPDRVRGLVERRSPVAIVGDPGGPAGPALLAIANELKKMKRVGAELTPFTTRDLVQSSGGFLALITEPLIVDGEPVPKLAHPNEPLLTSAAAVVQPRPIGQSWAFDRRNFRASMSPLMAASFATHGLLARSGDQKPPAEPQVDLSAPETSSRSLLNAGF